MGEPRRSTKIATSLIHTQPDVDHYFQALEHAKPAPASNDNQKKIDINEEIARERKIRNDNAEQDISLKRTTLITLFIFLAIETFLIFLLALFQAVGWPGNFSLDELSFRLLIGATIAQITGMLFVAVRYLFPNNKEG
ncbi:MAG TPA: hypothetical protein VFT16_02240 [Candidatus Saccharimonadales bacterium]|nr:hypothetical protein [Candidatus Saccharimonadales bacterium]